MFCDNAGCDNEVLDTEHWRLPEERRMSPTPHYCSQFCAGYVRKINYLSATAPVELYIEGHMRINGGAHA